MKYLGFTDFHLSGKNSRNRLGNYFEDLLLKFDEILLLAKTHNCEAIFDFGDLFETDKPSYNVIDEIADRAEKAKIPIYSLYGNHNMTAGHLENSNNTGLSHLFKRSKWFSYLDMYGDNDIETKNRFVIKGYDYKYNIEEDIKRDGIIIEGSDETWKIGIVHALITPSKFFDNVSHIVPEDIQTNANLILCGHYHKPFVKVVGQTTYLNIGCSGRLNIDEANIEPSVVLLDTDTRSYEVIKLKSAKKGSEIFDLSKYDELKANKKDIKDFINSLRNVDLQSMDLTSQIFNIAKQQKLSTNITDYIITKLENIKNEI
jgi:DNA repair exonuclease SbcCD nuclease subunit